MAENLKLRIEAETKEAVAEVQSLQRSADASLKQIGASASSSSRIAKEAFETGASEIIESWGVDGDIANEIGKMLSNLPGPFKAAMIAIAAEFVIASAQAAALIAVVSKMIDVAKEVGDGSAEEFRKFQKSMREAGVTVSELDRAMSQDLTKAAKQVEDAINGMFVELIRESGPAAVLLFREVRDEINSLGPVVNDFGKYLSAVFLGLNVQLRTVTQTFDHFINAIDYLSKGGAVNRALALAELAQAVAFSQRYAENTQAVIEEMKAYKTGTATYDTKSEKGPDREAAAERAEERLRRLRNKEREDTVESLRNNEVLRAATDGYLNNLQAKVDRTKGFLALLTGIEKNYTDAVKAGQQAAKELRDLQYETAEIELNRLSTYAGNELVIYQARAELRRQAEIERNAAVQRELQAQIEANRITVADDAAAREQKLRNLQLLNQSLEEEQKRHQAELDLIRRGEQLQTERADPRSARSLFGDAFADELQASQNRIRAFAVSARESFAQASAAAGNLGTIGSRAFGQFAAGLGEVVRAFVLTGQTGPAALRRLTAAVLAEVAQQAAVKAVFELASGFAALALGDPRAALHFQAAGLYGAVAAVAGGIGAAVSPGASAASGGALGNAVAGQNEANRRDETRYRFTERDGSGIPQANLIVTIVTDQAQQIANVERASVSSYRQGGALKSITDNALSGIPITTAG